MNPLRTRERYEREEDERLSALAEARCGLAQLDAARVAAENALALARERSLGGGEVLAQMALARIGLALGDSTGLAEARAAVAAGEAKAEELGQRLLSVQIAELQARVALGEGDEASWAEGLAGCEVDDAQFVARQQNSSAKKGISSHFP